MLQSFQMASIGLTRTSKRNSLATTMLSAPPLGVPASDCIRVGYAWRKCYPTDTPLNEGSDYTQLRQVYPEIRLAEIYLDYAEACNEKPQRDEANAFLYLNKVRNRVGD
jgi:hypothetical protein